jgi:hypothetical protein
MACNGPAIPRFLDEGTPGTVLACSLVTVLRRFEGPVFQGDHVRFHTERDRRLHPMRDTQMSAPPPGRFVNRRRGDAMQRPIDRNQRSRLPLHDDENVDDLLVIDICYEAHLSMQQMLAAFAQIRGDDTVDPIG